MSVEDTVKFLWDCAKVLSPNSHTNKLLKSHYMNNCRRIAQTQLKVPKEKFAVSQMCPRCGSCWHESEFQLKLQPQQVANSGKARKLIAKLEASKVAKNKESLLSRKQRKRGKWLKKRVASSLQLRCEFCQERTTIPLQKPKKMADTAVIVEPVEETAVIVANIKKKKNKSKNKTAGLKIPKELQETKQDKVHKHKGKPSVKEEQNETEAPPLLKEKSSSAIKTATPIIENSSSNNNVHLTQNLKAKKKSTTVTPAAANSKSSTNANLSQTFKAKKQKKKSLSKKQAPIAPKIQSKTQQQNSLLQLASLLKSQASKAATNTVQNRLESLLK